MSSVPIANAISLATFLIQVSCLVIAIRILTRHPIQNRKVMVLLWLSLPLAVAHAMFLHQPGPAKLALCGVYTICVFFVLWVIKNALEQRKIREETASHRLAFHRSIFADSAIPLGLFECKSRKMVTCNQAMADILGYGSIGEVVGLSVAAFSASHQSDGLDSLSASLEKEKECLEKGSIRFLWRHQRPNGQIWDAQVHLMRLAPNGDTFFEFTLQDVSEVLCAEAAHRQDQIRLKVLSEVYEKLEAPDSELIDDILEGAMALTHSENAYFHFLNPEEGSIRESYWSKQIRNHSQNLEYRGLKLEKAGLWAEGFHQRKIVIHNEFQKAGGEKNLPEGHIPIVRHMSVPIFEGEHIVILAGVGNKASDYTEADGLQLRNLIAAFWNVVRRRRLETQLQESETRWQYAMESAGDGLWDWDIETGQVYHSERWLAMLGEEGHGDEISDDAAWRDRIHPEDQMKACAAIENHLKGETDAYISEYRMRKRDGSYTWILDRGRVVKRAEGGRPLRMVGTHTDTSERKRAEQSLADARKMESLAVLAGGIAHDFNNLFTSMLGSVEIAELTLGEGASEFKHLERIRSSVLKASNLSRQMLAFSGMGRFIVEPIELNQLITANQEALKMLVDPDIAMTFDLAELNLMLEGDPFQMQQMLEILISNAKEAVLASKNENSKVIRVMTSLQMFHQKPEKIHFFGNAFKPGLYIRLSVEDQGCGMDPEHLERIFEPFFTTKFVGRGMSLPVVQGIMRAHGGGVGVESQVEVGSTFTLYFPVSEAMIEIRSDRSKSGLEGLPPACTHILLVEDDDVLRDVLMRALQKRGFDVVEASDGHAAVEIYQVRWQEICVVLMDLSMPRMDGRGAFKAMKQVNPEVRVVMTSGYGERDVVEMLQDKDLAGFIAKPYQLKDVVALLEKLMGRATGNVANPSESER